MFFLETMPDVVDSLNALEQDENLKSPPSKKVKSFQESDAKAALWTALANSLNSQTSNLQANIAGTEDKSENNLAERVKLFGETVADNQDYEQGIVNGAQQSLPIKANSFAFPAFSPLTQHNSIYRNQTRCLLIHLITSVTFTTLLYLQVVIALIEEE